MYRVSDNESRCESEGECDYGSVDEEDAPMPQLMDVRATTIAPAMPSTTLTDCSAVTSYLRPSYPHIALDELVGSDHTVTLSHSECVVRGPDGQAVGDVPWNANDLERVKHEPQATAKADVNPLDWIDG
jgi:hypothetical protein